jgi:outer membrane protein assembly factor BamB
LVQVVDKRSVQGDNVRKKIAVAAFLVIAIAVSPIATWAQTQPKLRLSKTVGPPTTKLKVSGQGFTPNVDVSIAFDSAVLARTRTDDSGTFSRVSLRVPQLATPGNHRVSGFDPAGLSGVATFLVQTEWPQFHFSPLHSGYNPYEFTLSAATVSGLSLSWSDSASACASPVVAGGSVYFPLQTSLQAVDANSGTPLWTYSTGTTVCTTPAVSGGMVFFGGIDGGVNPPGHVYALKASSGTLLWSFPTSRGIFFSSLTVVNGVVYAVCNDGTVYALKASTGTLLWNYATGEDASSPAVANGIVYVAGNRVYALSAKTGAVLWSNLLGTNVWDGSNPVLANGAVYFGTVGSVYALDAINGSTLWTYPAGFVVSTPAVTKGAVYVGSLTNNTLYALNAKTGAPIWTNLFSGDFLSASPSVANGVVYVGASDHYFYALDANNGSVLWSYDTGGNTGDCLTCSPAVVEGAVYVITASDTVWAFR